MDSALAAALVFIRACLKTPTGRRAAAPVVDLRGRSTLELAVFAPPKSTHIAEDMATFRCLAHGRLARALGSPGVLRQLLRSCLKISFRLLRLLWRGELSSDAQLYELAVSNAPS